LNSFLPKSRKLPLVSRDNSLGQKYTHNGKNFEDFKNAHLSTIRQIGHEILKTLCPKYTCNNYNQVKGPAFGNFKLYYTVKKSDKPDNQK